VKEIPEESLRAFVTIALVFGLLFSLWSGYETVTGNTGSCTANSFVSCGAVRNSGHTSAFGIPYWAMGVAGYVAMLAVAILLWITSRLGLLYALVGLSTLGFALSLYFIYLELAVIGAICPVCTAAHAANVAVLVGTVMLVRRA
jgi:uncharacterized membrane protein